jgi:hypothetical protein
VAIKTKVSFWLQEFHRREAAGTRSLDHDEPPVEPRGFSRSSYFFTFKQFL